MAIQIASILVIRAGNYGGSILVVRPLATGKQQGYFNSLQVQLSDSSMHQMWLKALMVAMTWLLLVPVTVKNL